MHFALKRAAVYSCLIVAHLYEERTFIDVIAAAQVTRQLVFAQQHKATRHAFCAEPCASAKVFVDCTLD